MQYNNFYNHLVRYCPCRIVIYDNCSLSTVLAPSSPNPRKFPSIESDTSVFCYVDEGDLGTPPKDGNWFPEKPIM